MRVKDVEVWVKEAEFEASDAEVDSSGMLELEIPFNWSSEGAWKVSESGFEQFLPLDGVEQQAHKSEALL